MKINFYNFKDVEDSKLKFAVVMARYKDQWIFVRHKERDTWEIPGGHREKNEAIKDTASRELYEETGAIKFKLKCICIYSVFMDEDDTFSYNESFGALYYAEVEKLGQLPESEICEIQLFDSQPENLTYPLIQPHLFNKVGRIYT
ncbi:MAG: NUDIX domain-containing protein [Clostridium sp.]|uniref:NUDIX hydrolase n=1 Tax=Clostridium sp. TaxID=1506 RepID=UPI003067AA9C